MIQLGLKAVMTRKIIDTCVRVVRKTRMRIVIDSRGIVKTKMEIMMKNGI